MRTTLVRLALPALAALLLISCTRDRPTPEATAAVTPSPGATTAAGSSAGSSGTGSTLITGSVTSSAEPAVQTTDSTPTPEATAEITSTPTADTGKKFEYTVKPGETLAELAAKFDTTVQTLRELNFLLDDNIFAGQILEVPFKEGMTAEGAPTPTPTPFSYVVQAGDTLSSISAKFNVKSGTLIEVNNITDPNNLTVGTPLLIPGYVAPAAANAGAASGDTGITGSTAGSTAGGDSAGAAGGAAVTHVVQPGETLGAIAADYGVDPVALAQANNIANGNLIRVGQKLIIPGVTAQQVLQARGKRHVVATGESLSEIAQKYGVTVDAILAANKITDPNKIMVGQELLIPPPQ